MNAQADSFRIGRPTSYIISPTNAEDVSWVRVFVRIAGLLL